MAIAHALFAAMIGAGAAHDIPAAKIGEARPAMLRSGAIVPDDYPPSALRAGAEGTTSLRYLVGADGRVLKCAIEGTSGNAALDSTACQLVQRRYRFRPAIGADGHPVEEWRSERVEWTLPPQTPADGCG